MIIVGVDPGLKGAIATLDAETGMAAVDPMPVIDGKRPEYDLFNLYRVVLTAKQSGAHIVIERPQPLPATLGGAIANFHRGHSLGLWEATCFGLEVPVTFVPPRTWQKEMLAGVSGDDTKQRSLVAAQRLFPAVSLKRTERCKKLDDGYSDALLIAEYGRRHLTTHATGASPHQTPQE